MNLDETITQELVQKNLKEKKLNLIDLKATKIDSNAFDKLNDLERLIIQNNKLTFIPYGLFSNFTSLKKLDLSFNQIKALSSGLFENLTYLDELIISNNDIAVLEANQFQGLINLNKLIFTYNRTTQIDETAFNGLISLKTLVLSNNLLKDIKSKTFSNLTSLERFNLKENLIEGLDNDVFKTLSNLEQIQLYLNRLNKLDSTIFENQKKIQRLFLRNNHLTEIHSKLFNQLENLIFIDLESNLINRLYSNQFSDLTSLESVDLAKNKIDYIPSNAFNNLAKLKTIGLDKNLINKIDKQAFTNLPSLQIIKLDFNLITHIDSIVFSDLKSILELHCNTLQISDIKLIQEDIIKRNREIFLQNVSKINEIYNDDLLNIFNSIDAYHLLEYLSVLSNRNKYELFKLINKSNQNNLIFILTTSLQNLYNDIAIHIKNYKPFKFVPKCIALSFIDLCLAVVANWSNFSLNFCKQFVKNFGIKILFLFLNSLQLQNELKKATADSSKYMNSLLSNIYSKLLTTVFNLVIKGKTEFKNELIEANSLETLIRLSLNFSDCSNIQLKAYMIIANLLDEETMKNIDQLVHIKTVVKELVKYASECAQKISDGTNLERCPMIFNNKNEELNTNNQINEVTIIEINESFFYLVDILNVLYNFALNDDIKYDIYVTYSLENYLKLIIFNGNEIEKEYSLMLLWQLCFDQRVADLLKKDQKLVKYIDEISNKTINKNAQGILWILRNEKHKELKQTDQKHVMISYNSKSRDICLNLKKELEKDGFSVWIDVESISGSSLESMADAIENSFCVLVCATEKYKESNNCRLEAEYVIQQKKFFIPLILEKGYKPTGWLGMLFGTRIFVDMTKLELSTAYKEIKRLLEKAPELKPIINQTINNYSSVNEVRLAQSDEHDNRIIEPSNSKSEVEAFVKKIDKKCHKAIDWNENQVNDWMIDSNICIAIRENLTPLNGEVLFQLYSILKCNPEFFYGALKNNNFNGWSDLKDLAQFCSKLKDLFRD